MNLLMREFAPVAEIFTELSLCLRHTSLASDPLPGGMGYGGPA